MNSGIGNRRIERIAFLGNYLPRRCGIATFTTDLCEAISRENPEIDSFTVAMNDRPEGYSYPSKVRFEIEAGRREQYDLAADFINLNQADVINIQHEYGIFGGKAGRYLLPLLRRLRAPLVTTLHTILTQPDPEQKQVMNELIEISDRLVAMSPRALEYLQNIYKAPAHKLRLIHHGIPDMPFIDPSYYKDHFGAEGRKVLLTFGLLSPGKGIEYAIDAMPAIVERYPEALYIVLGATHPHIKRDQGEQYRTTLQQRVRELGMERHVRFQNRFVELSELCEYLGAADIYVTPYLGENQIVSGTLAYSMGTGKAVVSTPYWYAQDMLSDERGKLVPFRNAEAISEAVLQLFDNETERHAMRKRAYQTGRTMIWSEIVRQYLSVYEEAKTERSRSPRPVGRGSEQALVEDLPELNPQHLNVLTDSVGIFQHARFNIPDPLHGYCTDDQARALIVAVKASRMFPDLTDWELLVSRYLSFLLYAFDAESGRFGNFLNYRREWDKPVATDDAHARAIWGLAHVVAYSLNDGHRALATQLLDQSIPLTTSFNSPRAVAFSILSIQTYLQKFSGASSFRRERGELAYKLFERFQGHTSPDWPWPEEILTYANARIPHALIEAGQWIPDQAMIECGLRSLEWLDRVQTSEKGHFVPIGTQGWFRQNGLKARFDQQPIEAFTMIDACTAAYRATRDEKWLSSARRAFDWFLGRNDLQAPLYDARSGGCYDGLHPDRVNQNQGAESTVVWLLSLLLMYEIQDEMHTLVKEPAHEDEHDAVSTASPG
ncbi:MAG: glycosyl transferase family 1 [Lentisphaerae bacterium GWF2_57_35]|nr:MAG: glycosyl transferase family 1 [Lentisphaerae bacterium GWF2_57_35]